MIMTGGGFSMAGMGITSEIHEKDKEIKNLEKILELKN